METEEIKSEIIDNQEIADYYIYRITNMINNKVYIGQTNNTDRRYREHHNKPKGDFESVNDCIYLYRSVNKHGEHNFQFDIIEELYGTRKQITALERYWILEYNSIDRNFGYNIRLPGDENTPGTLSEETRQKMSAAHKGKIFTEEHRKKIGDAHRGEKSAMYGKHHADEIKEKIGIKSKESWLNPDFRDKTIASRKEFYQTEEGQKRKEAISEFSKNWFAERRRQIESGEIVLDPLKSNEKLSKLTKKQLVEELDNGTSVDDICKKYDTLRGNVIKKIRELREKNVSLNHIHDHDLDYKNMCVLARQAYTTNTWPKLQRDRIGISNLSVLEAIESSKTIEEAAAKAKVSFHTITKRVCTFMEKAKNMRINHNTQAGN